MPPHGLFPLGSGRRPRAAGRGWSKAHRFGIARFGGSARRRPLVALNAVGSALMPDGKTYWAWPSNSSGEFEGRGPPRRPMDLATRSGRIPLSAGRMQPGGTRRWRHRLQRRFAASGMQTRRHHGARRHCTRRASRAHAFDGDTIFALASGALDSTLLCRCGPTSRASARGGRLHGPRHRPGGAFPGNPARGR